MEFPVDSAATAAVLYGFFFFFAVVEMETAAAAAVEMTVDAAVDSAATAAALSLSCCSSADAADTDSANQQKMNKRKRGCLLAASSKRAGVISPGFLLLFIAFYCSLPYFLVLFCPVLFKCQPSLLICLHCPFCCQLFSPDTVHIYLINGVVFLHQSDFMLFHFLHPFPYYTMAEPLFRHILY